MPFLQFPFRPGAILYFQSSFTDDKAQSNQMAHRTQLCDCVNFMNQSDEGTRLCLLGYGVLSNVTRDQKLERPMGSRWFADGWRLREFVGRKPVDFYSADWSNLGTLWSLKDVSYRATLVDSSDITTQTTSPGSSSVIQNMLERSDKRVKVLRCGGDEMEVLLGRFTQKGIDVLAWTYYSTSSNRSFRMGIPEFLYHGLRKYLRSSLDKVTLVTRNQIGQKRRSSMPKARKPMARLNLSSGMCSKIKQTNNC
jgi:hypothetical protein